MKKYICTLAIMSIVFVGCGSDDESTNDESTNLNCQTCGFTTGETVGATNEYCDNGDGTVTVTVRNWLGQDVTTTTPLAGSLDEFIMALEETTGIECNSN